MRQTVIYIAAVGFALCAAMVLSRVLRLPIHSRVAPRRCQGICRRSHTHDSRAPVPLGVLTATPVPQTSTLVRQIDASTDDAGDAPVSPSYYVDSTAYNEVYLGFCENRQLSGAAFALRT